MFRRLCIPWPLQKYVWWMYNISLWKLSSVYRYLYTVKPANAVTSIKQSPVLKGHFFLVQSLRNSYKFNLLRDRLSYKAIFICPKGDLLIQVWRYDNYIMLWKKVSTVKVRNSININQEQPTSHFQSWKIKKDDDMAIYIDKQFNDLQKTTQKT